MILAGLYFIVIAEVGGVQTMMQTLDGDGRITPVDVLMIVQVALCLNIMGVTL